MEVLPSSTDEQIRVTAMDPVTLQSRDLRRSVRFYARVFGFRPVADSHERQRALVLHDARSGACLAIRCSDDGAVAQKRRWNVFVADLDDVRETLWNKGLVPIDAALSAPSDRGGRRFLVVRDPDGHEIELVERPRSAQREPPAVPCAGARRAACGA